MLAIPGPIRREARRVGVFADRARRRGAPAAGRWICTFHPDGLGHVGDLFSPRDPAVVFRDPAWINVAAASGANAALLPPAPVMCSDTRKRRSRASRAGASGPRRMWRVAIRVLGTRRLPPRRGAAHGESASCQVLSSHPGSTITSMASPYGLAHASNHRSLPPLVAVVPAVDLEAREAALAALDGVVGERLHPNRGRPGSSCPGGSRHRWGASSVGAEHTSRRHAVLLADEVPQARCRGAPWAHAVVGADLALEVVVDELAVLGIAPEKMGGEHEPSGRAPPASRTSGRTVLPLVPVVGDDPHGVAHGLPSVEPSHGAGFGHPIALCAPRSEVRKPPPFERGDDFPLPRMMHMEEPFRIRCRSPRGCAGARG